MVMKIQLLNTLSSKGRSIRSYTKTSNCGCFNTPSACSGVSLFPRSGMVAIVGDLPSKEVQEEPMAIQRQDGSWLLDGLLSMDEMREVLGNQVFPENQTHEYYALGRFVIHFLMRITRAGEYFEWDGLRLK